MSKLFTKNNFSKLFDIIIRCLIFILIAYVSISALIGYQLASINKVWINDIIDMDTVQCNKINQLIDSNNDLVKKVDFLMEQHFKNK